MSSGTFELLFAVACALGFWFCGVASRAPWGLQAFGLVVAAAGGLLLAWAVYGVAGRLERWLAQRSLRGEILENERRNP